MLKGAGVGALAIGAYAALQMYAPGALLAAEAALPILLPGAIIGAAIFGLIKIASALMPPKKA